jgi:phosphotransferase system  glucose/maltose/N-acetylglucosamine-specific IIC component
MNNAIIKIMFIAAAGWILFCIIQSLIPYTIEYWLYILGAIVAAIVIYTVAYIFIGNIYNKPNDTPWDQIGPGGVA